MPEPLVESAEPEKALAGVRKRIAEACRRAGRHPDDVCLIGVTKSVPPDEVRRAAAAGLREFGENYVRDMETKRTAAPEATWHFLGRLQRNKVRRVLDVADVVQALEPGRATERMAEVAQQRGRVVRCMVEIDFTGTRVGVGADQAEAFLAALQDLPSLEVVGLMTVAPLDGPSRPYFARLRELRDRLSGRFPGLRELSMGMSADYEEAVEEGATMVRVGTAIFGPRP
ncbi:MAG: YggS family pyridoxal phosphate-dependent enzyme [Actinomycetota bacterium]